MNTQQDKNQSPQKDMNIQNLSVHEADTEDNLKKEKDPLDEIFVKKHPKEFYEKECSNIVHQKAGLYKYTCEKCLKDKNCGKKILPSGNWCNCICKHNTYFCIKCKKPVKKIGGMYYYVK